VVVKKAIEKLEELREMVIEQDCYIELNSILINKVINFLESDMPVDSWLDSEQQQDKKWI
jgi:hypothetical protein